MTSPPCNLTQIYVSWRHLPLDTEPGHVHDGLLNDGGGGVRTRHEHLVQGARKVELCLCGMEEKVEVPVMRQWEQRICKATYICT
jgi:hypothetical protein